MTSAEKEPECTCTCPYPYKSIDGVEEYHDGGCPRYEPSILSAHEVDEIKADAWTNASTIKDLVCSLEVERRFTSEIMEELRAARGIVVQLAAESPAVLTWTDSARTVGTGQCIHCDNAIEWDQEEGWLTGLHAEHCVWLQAVELFERVALRDPKTGAEPTREEAK
jgi:hypothetical protein